MNPAGTLPAFAAALCLLALQAAPSRACLARLQPHELDPAEQQVDTTPPGPIEVLDVEVHRGRGPSCEGFNSWAATSIDGTGTIAITINPPIDDRTPVEQMGYRVTLVEGELENDMIPEFDFRIRDEAIYLHWYDGDTDDQEPIDLTIAIQAIDLAGNLGARSDPVTIRHPGSGGCATAAHNTVEAWMCLLALALVYLRRRRRTEGVS